MPGIQDSMFANHLWRLGSLSDVANVYGIVHGNGVRDASNEKGILAGSSLIDAPEFDDDVMTMLSSSSGISKMQVNGTGRAKLLGQRAVNADSTALMCENKFGLNLDELSSELVKMDDHFNGGEKGKESKESPNLLAAEKISLAREVLVALLNSKEMVDLAKAMPEGDTISIERKLALLNAGLGCMKMIQDGTATTESIFELVDSKVYDISKAKDVLDLSVKTAKAAFDKFVNADKINSLVETAIAGIEEVSPEIWSNGQKAEKANEIRNAAKIVIAERRKIAERLNVQVDYGDGSKTALESKINDVRERLRSFRYDLDRIGGKNVGFDQKGMTPMERMRRRFDNIGRSAPTLTAEGFGEMRKSEEEFNDLLVNEVPFKAGDERSGVEKLETAFSRKHFNEVTEVTHLANTRIRYYFSGKEQQLSKFETKALETLKDIGRGGSRSIDLEFDVSSGLGKVLFGPLEAGISAGVTIKTSAKITVNEEITLVIKRGANVHAGLEFSPLGAKASGGFDAGEEVTIKYRDAKSFIAAMKGESALISRSTETPLSGFTGWICNLGTRIGRTAMRLSTYLGFRISKSHEDNAAFIAKMQDLGVFKVCDVVMFNSTNVVKTQVGNANYLSAGVNGEVKVKADIMKAEASTSASYSRTLNRKSTDYRTILDSARNQSEGWLREHVGRWYDNLPVDGGANRVKVALREIEDALRKAEHEIASKPVKTKDDWQKFAVIMGQLSLCQAYVEKQLSGEMLEEVQAFAEMLVDPKVSVPDDIYQELMMQISNITTNGSVSKSWSYKAGFSVGLMPGSGNIVGDALVSSVSAASGSTGMSTNVSITTTSPVKNTSICQWSNASTISTTIALSTGMTGRALIEAMAEAYVDTQVKSGETSQEDVEKMYKAVREDFTSTFIEEMKVNGTKEILNMTIGVLSKASTGLANILGGIVKACEFKSEYQKRITFTCTNGRLSGVVVDDAAMISNSIKGEAGLISLKMTDTYRESKVDRKAMIRPTINNLMGCAEDCLRAGGKSTSVIKKMLSHNLPGVLRLFRAITTDPGKIDEVKVDKFFKKDGEDFRNSFAEALYLMDNIVNTGKPCNDAIRDRASKLLNNLNLMNEKFNNVINDKAKQIDVMTDAVRTMTEAFMLARETTFFSRSASNEIIVAP